MTPTVQRRRTHRARKAAARSKEAARYKDGLGKHRVTLSQVRAAMKTAPR